MLNVLKLLLRIFSNMLKPAPTTPRPAVVTIPPVTTVKAPVQSNFIEAFRFTVGAEGGYTNNPNDPGNWTGGQVGVGSCNGTNYGISAASYPDLDIESLTITQAQDIYKRDYWDKVSGDSFPRSIAMVLFDGAVNSGIGQSVIWVQGVVGVTQDGILGPITKNAILTSSKLPLDIALDALANRAVFLSKLSVYPTFALGWDRRVIRLASVISR